MRREGVAAVREAAALLQAGVRLPERIVSMPWLGPWLPLAFDQWLLCAGMASVVLWFSELRKLGSRAWSRREDA